MYRDDAKRLLDALIHRRHNDALRIKILRRRLNDDTSYSYVQSISGDPSAVPDGIPDKFSPSKINSVLKLIKKLLIKRGENGRGRVEIHTIDKYGHSRDFYTL